MKYDKTKNHIERMLELAEKYANESDKIKSEYWFEKAAQYEKKLNKQREKSDGQKL